jgi:hypothetical protein
MKTAFVYPGIPQGVNVLQLIVLLAILLFQLPGEAATGNDNEWLKPAREAITVARKALESFCVCVA